MTELSGNESFVHVAVGAGAGVSGGAGERRLVCLVHGVHDWAPGARAEVLVDPAGVFVFDRAGQRVRLPASAPVPVSA